MEGLLSTGPTPSSLQRIQSYIFIGITALDHIGIYLEAQHVSLQTKINANHDDVKKFLDVL